MVCEIQNVRSMLADGCESYRNRVDAEPLIAGWGAFVENFDWHGAACFIFSGIDIGDPDVEDFAKKLVAYEVVQLPSDDCYFQWDEDKSIVSTIDGKNGLKVGDPISETCFLLTSSAPSTNEQRRVRFLRGTIVNGDQRCLGLPFIVDLYGADAAYYLNASVDELKCMDALKICAATTMIEFLSCLSLIATKGLTETHHGPSTRVAYKREKRGLDPLPSYVHISTSRSAISVAARAHGIDRNSPRPHFRRGHIREIFKATEKTRFVTVGPTWVNADLGETPTKRPYLVK